MGPIVEKERLLTRMHQHELRMRESQRFTHSDKKDRKQSVIVSKLSLVINGRIEGVNVTHKGSKGSLHEGGTPTEVTPSKSSSAPAINEPAAEKSVESNESDEKMNIT